MQRWTSTFALCTYYDDDDVGHLGFATFWINYACFGLYLMFPKNGYFDDYDCVSFQILHSWSKEKKKSTCMTLFWVERTGLGWQAPPCVS